LISGSERDHSIAAHVVLTESLNDFMPLPIDARDSIASRPLDVVEHPLLHHGGGEIGFATMRRHPHDVAWAVEHNLGCETVDDLVRSQVAIGIEETTVPRDADKGAVVLWKPVCGGGTVLECREDVVAFVENGGVLQVEQGCYKPSTYLKAPGRLMSTPPNRKMPGTFHSIGPSRHTPATNWNGMGRCIFTMTGLRQ